MNDLDLVVELINTVWVLADPPDSLTDTNVYRDILIGVGERQLADDLATSDLGRLRALRERLRAVFHAQTAQEAAALVNTLLKENGVSPRDPTARRRPGRRHLARLGCRPPRL